MNTQLQSLLVIENITKTYTQHGQSHTALAGVSFDIKRGEIFALLGANGAGKTTLSSIIATVHPPTSGTIFFNGTSIYQNIYTYRRALGFCPQYQNLDNDLSVLDNLLFAGRYFLVPEDTIIQRANALMQSFNLTRYAHASVHTLSGGTKQRLLIARALMHNPELVILDEPTVGLDPDIRRILWEHIKQLKSMGITVILTTHYLDEAQELSDRVCFLSKGSVVLIESMQSLRERHNMASLEDIFLKFMHEQSEGE